MKKPLPLFFICVALLLPDCKRDIDTITAHTITGQVYNLATDSGLANVEVFLNTQGPGGYSSRSAISDHNGGFSFGNVQIHSNTDYTYALNVPSNGAGGYKPAINGATLTLDRSYLDQTQTLHVVPSVTNWYLYFPANTPLSSSDTVLLTMEQKTLHANLPDWNYKLTFYDTPAYPAPNTNYLGNVGAYWMGWWYSTLDKTKNGVHTIKTDSFYVGWGATVTDTIPW